MSFWVLSKTIGWLYDGGMVVFHIVLRHMSVILDFLFGQEILDVNLLEKDISFVLFVCEDAFDRGCRPGFLAAGCKNASEVSTFAIAYGERP